MMQQLESYTLLCRGGLTSSQNWLELSALAPGSATELLNMEPSLFGGYRKINGYQVLSAEQEEVPGEGRILGVFIFGDRAYAARQEVGGTNYSWFIYTPSVGWEQQVTGLTLSSTGVFRVRHATFNFNGTDKIALVDGVNPLTIFDGTSWTQIIPSQVDNDQALPAPSYVAVFQNHLFVSGERNFKHIVSHSAPLDDQDWTAASGAGQIVAGFDVRQIYPFRDELYVFGETKISKIQVNGVTFLISDVTKNLGCTGSDTVLEVNGDLIFLSQDGFRPISATERLNDVELASISKQIQIDVTSLLKTYEPENILGVVLRGKSQVRFFFTADGTPPEASVGILGGLTLGQEGASWEWSRLRGIKASCVTSAYVGQEEWILHGGFDGKVYRQEVGSSFAGRPITSIYRTPYIDFGDPSVRKTMREVNLFLRREGAMRIDLGVRFDWLSPEAINPADYQTDQGGGMSGYGSSIYGVSSYASQSSPVTSVDIQGSGFSTSFLIVSNDINPPFTIHGLTIGYSVNGKK